MNTIKSHILGAFMLPGFIVGWLARATREGFEAGYWWCGKSLDHQVDEANRKRGAA